MVVTLLTKTLFPTTMFSKLLVDAFSIVNMVDVDYFRLKAYPKYNPYIADSKTEKAFPLSLKPADIEPSVGQNATL